MRLRPGTNYDGSLGAPSGTPQLEGLLDLVGNTYGVSLAIRTPWLVAGVDYLVGITPGTVLKDILTDTVPSGCSRDTATKLLRVQAGSGDVTIDGWDLDGGGVGYIIYIVGGFTGNLTISNCNFKVGTKAGSCIQQEIAAAPASVTIRRCKLDGNYANASVPYLIYLASINVLVEYNWFLRSRSDAFNAFPHAARGGLSRVEGRFNLFEDMGGNSSGAHPDCVQLTSTGTTSDSGVFWWHHNTVKWSIPDGDNLPYYLNAFVIVGGNNGKMHGPVMVDHNTAVGIANTGHLDPLDTLGTTGAAFNTFTQIFSQNGGIGTPGCIKGTSVNDNYIYTAAGGIWNTAGKYGFISYPYRSPDVGMLNVTYANNIRMTDDTVFPVPS